MLWTLLETGGRSERDKPDRRRSTKLTLVHYFITVYQVLSTAHFSLAGQLVTADTCFFEVTVCPPKRFSYSAIHIEKICLCAAWNTGYAVRCLVKNFYGIIVVIL